MERSPLSLDFRSSGGFGDLLLTAWLRPDATFLCDGGKAELASLFGLRCSLEAAEGSRVVPMGHKYDGYIKTELTITRGNPHRAIVWGRDLGSETPLQPLFTGHDKPEFQEGRASGLSFKGDKKSCIMFPLAEFHCRRWPNSSFVRTSWDLQRLGWAVGTMIPSQKHAQKAPDMPFYWWGHSWAFVCGVLSTADCIVANDSGPAHLGAALGVPTVALTGPTRGVFQYSPSVLEMHADSNQASCVGCYFAYDKGYRALCDEGCGALSAVGHSRVAGSVVSWSSDCPTRMQTR
jgi:hypothetical protein